MSLWRQFVATAQSRPDALAVISSRGGFTYRQLLRRAAGIGQVLRSRGVGPEVPVGLCLPRSPESMLAILGVLAAGGVYVPIDPGYPIERQRFMAGDLELHTLLVATALAPVPAWAPCSAILDLSGPADAEHDDAVLTAPPADPDPESLIYILYTSGSTGRPKGVCGTHAQVQHRLRWNQAAFPFAAGEVVAHRTSLNFVDSVVEIFSGLLAGVPTAVVYAEEQADLGRFIAAVARHRVTRLTLVPSILSALLRAAPDAGSRLGAIRYWFSSGEEVTLPLLQRFRAVLPAATLVNLYGTTEVIDVTYAVFPAEQPLPVERVPIGPAVAGAELMVLDAAGEPVPDGESGELYIGGSTVLARGYHHRPLEEALRFPRHPRRADERVFRTGDIVRRMPSGEIHYLGRASNVTKIRGVRIELEEIERCLLAACPELNQIAIVPVKTASGTAENTAERLLAFVSPAGINLDSLRAAAERFLPTVMIPDRFVALAALPLSPNGKCDRLALAALPAADARPVAPEQAPRTPTERRLAALYAPHLANQPITREASFAQLGGDSLGLAELMAALAGEPGFARVDLDLLRAAPLAEVARALDGETREDEASPVMPRIALLPFAAAAGPELTALLVEASHDPALCAATELPAGMDSQRARAYCATRDGVAIQVDGELAGAAIAHHHPRIGECEDGVVIPAGSVQLDEWLLARFHGRGILGVRGAWPLLARWLAQRFTHEISIVWEDNAAMLALLRARGYRRLGRTYWESGADGDGSAGWCEVLLYDLAPHRTTAAESPPDDSASRRESPP
mgnify:CR=1 FL=1